MKPSTFAHFVSSLLYEKRCERQQKGACLAPPPSHPG